MVLRTILFFVFFTYSTLLNAQNPQNYASSVLICRSKQCAPADKAMTSAFLFNKVVSLFETNMGNDVLLCDADPITHVCTENKISFPITAGVASSSVSLPAFKLLDAKLMKGQLGLNLIMSYYVFTNGRTVPCQNALSKIVVSSTSKVQISTPAFGCSFTQTGNTSLNAWFLIDYLDFDYGTIGAYYTIGTNQIVKGEKNGYVLMRFTKPQKSTVNEINLTPNTQTPPKNSKIPPSFIPTSNNLIPVTQDKNSTIQNTQKNILPPSNTAEKSKPLTSHSVANPLPIVTIQKDGTVVPKKQSDPYREYKQQEENSKKTSQENILSSENKKNSIKENTKSSIISEKTTVEILSKNEEETAWNLNTSNKKD